MCVLYQQLVSKNRIDSFFYKFCWGQDFGVKGVDMNLKVSLKMHENAREIDPLNTLEYTFNLKT